MDGVRVLVHPPTIREMGHPHVIYDGRLTSGPDRELPAVIYLYDGFHMDVLEDAGFDIPEAKIRIGRRAELLEVLRLFEAKGRTARTSWERILNEHDH
jgi:hypothetical protein